MADVDVEVVALAAEWSGEPGSDLDEGPEQADQHASEIFEAREKRLRRGTDELEKHHVIGDVEVPVFTESTEWVGETDQDEAPAKAEQHASEIYEARERRLTAGAEELEKDQVLGDVEVPVFAESREWSGAADDDPDDEAPAKADQHASEAFQSRERRLTAGAEELEKEMVIGDVDVPVVACKEWAGGDADSDNEPDQHASEVYESRERRLTVGAEELEKDQALGDVDVPLLAESKEWAGDADDDDEQANLDQHASDVFAGRERRLTIGAEELEKEGLLQGGPPVMQSTEWAGGAEDSDDEEAEAALEKREAEQYAQREKRITRASVKLDTGFLLPGDAEVGLVKENKEWAGADDSDDDEEAEAALKKREAEQYAQREKRISRASVQLDKGFLLPGDAELDLVKESKEWAGEEDSDDEEAEAALKKREAEQYAQREKRISRASVQLDKGFLLPGDAEVDLVKESKEWAGEDGSDDDAGDAQEKREADVYAARERRLTAGAEALQVVLGPDGLASPKASAANATAEKGFDPPARAAEPQPAAAADAGSEEGSEYETDEEAEADQFNRANPDLKYADVSLSRAAEKTDPWSLMFVWLTAVVSQRLEAEGPEAKRMRALLPAEGLKAADLTAESLCDGKILCALVIALRPEVLTKPIPNAMGRLAQVQKACKQLGVREADVFAPCDIMTPPPQNPTAVLRCLTSLASLNCWPEYSGPKLAKGRSPLS